MNMNTLLKISFFSAATIGLLTFSLQASASSVGGTLTPGGGLSGVGVTGTVVTPPIANPSAGVYTSTQNVTLTASGASSIHFTTDGSSPTCSTGTVYSSAISVSVSQVIEAISCYPGNASSTVASYLYAINPGSTGGGGGTTGSPISSPNIGTTGGTSGSQIIGIADFILLMENWGQTGLGNPADFNKDGAVNIGDFIWLMSNWNQ